MAKAGLGQREHIDMKTTTDGDLPETHGEHFYLRLDKNWFEVGDILNHNIVVISKPRTKWYHKLLNIITFGLYKVSIYYTVKLKE